MTARHPLGPEQIFAGRYRIERLLAEGGMGAVFVAEHQGTEQRVALKVLWPHVLASPSAVATFQFEAKVASRVSSENIVRVIDAGFDEATQLPFLVMELLTGQTLATLVESSGAVPPALVYEYLRQVASGLDRAHGYIDKSGVPQPIVHRDLKPENLFLSQRESGEPLLKILDFGIAKVVSSGAGVSQEIKGTPLFMAFEQAAGGALSAQTDIWALGLIAFWLLTGKHYWRAAQRGGLAQLFAEVMTLPIDPPSARAIEFGDHSHVLDTAFDDWFARCVERDSSRRFNSAGSAIEALGSVLSLTTTKSPPSSGYGLTRSSRAPVAALMSLGGAVLLSAAYLVFRAASRPAQTVGSAASELIGAPSAAPPRAASVEPVSRVSVLPTAVFEPSEAASSPLPAAAQSPQKPGKLAENRGGSRPASSAQPATGLPATESPARANTPPDPYGER